MKVVFTGGGTAGHVSPNLAIIEELKKICQRKHIDLDILYIGRLFGIEKNLVENEGIRYKGIFSGKFRRYWDWRNFTDPFLIVLGFLQSFFILLFYRPHIIFAKGGFVTVPVGIAGFLLRISLIIHESDSVLGLSNKILLRFCTKIALGFPLEVYSAFLLKKGIFTGNPVRQEIKRNILEKKELSAKYGFDKKRPVILILGGSQGAQRINEFIDNILNKLLDKYVVVHSAGEKGAGYFKEKRAKMEEEDKRNYLVFSFIKEEIGSFLNIADLVVSRAGANAIAEIIYLKKPSILIPYPFAASDHQRKNAHFLSQKGIASLLEEEHLNSWKLWEEIEYLMENKKERKKMIQNMGEVFAENSAKKIAEEIMGVSNL